MKINVLVLAGGSNVSTQDGYPVFLGEIGGEQVLSHIISNCSDLLKPIYHYAFVDTDVQKFY